jgi:hypothetical protein
MLSFSNQVEARPAILLHWCEVFKAVEISRNISSLLMHSLLADRVGFIDIIYAANFQVMRAIMAESQGEEGQQNKKQLHF